MSVTAVVISRDEYKRQWPGLEVLVHQSVIKTAADQQCARYSAALKVRTSHWFWLDDDDDLPADYLSVIDECIGMQMPLAYTDELIKSDKVGESITFRGNYSRDSHYSNPLKVHHLALYEAAESRKAIPSIPKGHYWPELPLAWVVARGGAGYVPRVGYIWNVRDGQGMHSWPSTQCARVRSLLWCKANP
jgi:hypothetical protein